MCGIAGIVARAENPSLAPIAERMVQALFHRGPDDHDVRDFGSCVLGNTRLAIVDLSERGRMPMCNEDATIWITYNGECYNSAELRALLESRGHQFKSATDTEVIVHLYEEFGESCAERLRGMFAFAIWDEREKKLLLARDRLGIKPLYYAATTGLLDGGILFASEIKAVLASGFVAAKVDPGAIRVFLQLGHIPPPWTAIREVKPLEPGHIGIWKDGHFKTRAYWRFPQPNKRSLSLSPQKVTAELREILVDSSRLQLMSDVPIALFLSGGVDSAVLGALMRSAGAERLTALTIGFTESEFDESQESQESAELLGIPHRVIRLSSDFIAKSLDNAVWAMDQPTMDGLNVYCISHAASQAGFKVTLSGQGGDELFGGYESVDWFERFTTVATWLGPLPSSAGRVVLDHESLPFRWRKLSYLVGADDPFVAAQMTVRLLFPDRDVRDLLNPELGSAKCQEAATYISEVASEAKGQDDLDRIAFVDLVAHLSARLLRDGDAMSMAQSLEVRPVLLDHVLVDYVMSLPASVRLREKKKLLLDAARDLMPPGLSGALAARPKRTFTFPFARWLGKDWRSHMDAAFHSNGNASGLLNPVAVNKLWLKYLANPSAVGWSRIWSVFVLARWSETMRVGI